MDRKLFVGSGIRRLRGMRRMSQAELAARLRISTAYLSQIESNQRPVSAAVLFTLTQVFGASISGLISEDPDRLAADLREALSGAPFGESAVSDVDIRSIAMSAPWLAHRFIELFGAYRRLAERDGGQGQDSASSALASEDSPLTPFEEVRDFFHYRDNYIDDLDQAAESLADREWQQGASPEAAMISYLERRHRVRLQELPMEDERRRAFDPRSRTLFLNSGLDVSTRRFQIALQIGLLEHRDTIEALAGSARIRSEDARNVAIGALTNYLASALLMPYGRFVEMARAVRHDIARLGHRFGASFEQVAHRLSTLQRPGARGVPVYFIKVDRAGNIVKRHSATRFQFARAGGACPLWNVHEAFEHPGRILVQHAEMPDGMSYLCIARATEKPGMHYGAVEQRYAIGLGCAQSDADQFVYADTINMRKDSAMAKIGITCRICPRLDCVQRSVPPAFARISIDNDARARLPYALSGG